MINISNVSVTLRRPTDQIKGTISLEIKADNFDRLSDTVHVARERATSMGYDQGITRMTLTEALLYFIKR